MLKPISMLLVFCLCSYLGVQRAARLQQRKTLLAELQTDIKRMMIRMEYERKPLAAIVFARSQGDLRPLWQTFARELQHGADTRSAFAEALAAADAEIAGFCTIGEEERVLLTDFAAALGGTELDGQKRNAAMLLAGLEPLWTQAGGECETKGHVYRTVGMLCGAAIVLLML